MSPNDKRTSTSSPKKGSFMQSVYLELVMLFERLHRLFLEVVKAELDNLEKETKAGKDSLSNVQALILCHIGNRQITVGEISNRGYYLGSNVSYNLKKMVKSGYVKQKPSASDKRSVYISLSDEGKKRFKQLETIFKKHMDELVKKNFSEEEIAKLLKQGRYLESFWSTLLLSNARLS
ncbi:MarR family winged helix-turn-helix transcriptional regulator [Candidatus Hepatobacter penaei]|uniref:MarR family winged helix-turn-helix transcriptional regulator n=1 Tax=Candidatus Hepatobacter penaei TaxID=1274402 RepID=UPI0004F3922A|nr:winged helix DNA-binding protein [Candidatus Hepatobacter penaei]